MSCLFLKQEFLWMAHTEVHARYDELFHLCLEIFFYILKNKFQLFIYLPSLMHDKHT